MTVTCLPDCPPTSASATVRRSQTRRATRTANPLRARVTRLAACARIQHPPS